MGILDVFKRKKATPQKPTTQTPAAIPGVNFSPAQPKQSLPGFEPVQSKPTAITPPAKKAPSRSGGGGGGASSQPDNKPSEQMTPVASSVTGGTIVQTDKGELKQIANEPEETKRWGRSATYYPGETRDGMKYSSGVYTEDGKFYEGAGKDFVPKGYYAGAGASTEGGGLIIASTYVPQRSKQEPSQQVYTQTAEAGYDFGGAMAITSGDVFNVAGGLVGLGKVGAVKAAQFAFSRPITEFAGMGIDFISPRQDTGFQAKGSLRQVARGGAFLAISPFTGVAFGKEIATSFISSPVKTSTELFEYSRKNPYEIATVSKGGAVIKGFKSEGLTGVKESILQSPIQYKQEFRMKFNPETDTIVGMKKQTVDLNKGTVVETFSGRLQEPVPEGGSRSMQLETIKVKSRTEAKFDTETGNIETPYSAIKVEVPVIDARKGFETRIETYEFSSIGEIPTKIGEARGDAAYRSTALTFTRPKFEDTVTLYHGTSSKFIESINKEGLRPSGYTGVSQGITPKDFVSTGTDLATAQGFATRAAIKSGGKPQVVKISLPRSEFEKLAVDSQALTGVGEVRLSKVPAEYINVKEKPQINLFKSLGVDRAVFSRTLTVTRELSPEKFVFKAGLESTTYLKGTDMVLSKGFRPSVKGFGIKKIIGEETGDLGSFGSGTRGQRQLPKLDTTDLSSAAVLSSLGKIESSPRTGMKVQAPLTGPDFFGEAKQRGSIYYGQGTKVEQETYMSPIVTLRPQAQVNVIEPVYRPLETPRFGLNTLSLPMDTTETKTKTRSGFMPSDRTIDIPSFKQPQSFAQSPQERQLYRTPQKVTPIETNPRPMFDFPLNPIMPKTPKGPRGFYFPGLGFEDFDKGYARGSRKLTRTPSFISFELGLTSPKQSPFEETGLVARPIITRRKRKS